MIGDETMAMLTDSENLCGCGSHTCVTCGLMACIMYSRISDGSSLMRLRSRHITCIGLPCSAKTQQRNAHDIHVLSTLLSITE